MAAQVTNVGPMGAQWRSNGGPGGLGLQIRDSNPGRMGRAQAPYARFFIYYTISFFLNRLEVPHKDQRSTRLRPNGLGGLDVPKPGLPKP